MLLDSVGNMNFQGFWRRWLQWRRRRSLRLLLRRLGLLMLLRFCGGWPPLAGYVLFEPLGHRIRNLKKMSALQWQRIRSTNENKIRLSTSMKSNTNLYHPDSFIVDQSYPSSALLTPHRSAVPGREPAKKPGKSGKICGIPNHEFTIQMLLTCCSEKGCRMSQGCRKCCPGYVPNRIYFLENFTFSFYPI